MKRPLISIIVPVYNVEKYLDKCVDSIVKQSYENIQIILVDDGSLDRCPKLCDAWKKKDERIIVIHKCNGGLSDARNIGLEHASGDYIAFVDSDDYIDINMYQYLLDKMVEYDCDIIQCDFRKIDESDNYIKSFDMIPKYSEFNREESIVSLIDESCINQMVWNKLYKRFIFDDLRFEVGKYNEDDFFMYQALNKCKKVGCVDYKFYYYLIRDTSIMGKKFSLKRLDGLEARFRRYLFIQKKYSQYANKEKVLYWLYIIYIYQKVLKIENMEECKKACSIVKNYFSKIKNDSISIKNTSIKTRVWIYLSSISLDLVCKIRNILKINCD